jgi:hypothetical protein
MSENKIDGFSWAILMSRFTGRSLDLFQLLLLGTPLSSISAAEQCLGDCFSIQSLDKLNGWGLKCSHVKARKWRQVLESIGVLRIQEIGTRDLRVFCVRPKWVQAAAWERFLRVNITAAHLRWGSGSHEGMILQ